MDLFENTNFLGNFDVSNTGYACRGTTKFSSPWNNQINKNKHN